MSLSETSPQIRLTSVRVDRPSLKRQLAFVAVLIGTGVFLALIVGECVLRFVPSVLPIETQRIVEARPGNYGGTHPYIGHLGKPFKTFINSGRGFSAVNHTDGYGFRNSWPWPSNVAMITVGDSLTFGQGVDDPQAWPAILASAFPRDPVVNLGLIGSGPQQYLRLYETFGTNLHPRVVLVGFFTGNDFWDADAFDDWLQSGAGVNYMVWRDFGRPSSSSLSLRQPVRKLASSLKWRANLIASRSYVYNLARYASGPMTQWTPPAKRVVYNAPDGQQLVLSPNNFAGSTKEANSGQRAFGLVLDALQRINSLAAQSGAKAVIVVQRSKEEVYLPLVDGSAPDSARPLLEALDERGIAYLDLLDEFRRHAARGEVLFLENDGHPNVEGYALIAELVISYVKKHAQEFQLSPAD